MFSSFMANTWTVATIVAVVAGVGHHFRVIQLPYNLAMPEGHASATQVVAGKRMTTTEAAARLGVAVIVEASGPKKGPPRVILIAPLEAHTARL